MNKLSSIQIKFKEVFGNLDCPVCHQPIDWDIHLSLSSIDWGWCPNDCDINGVDILITDEQEIEDLKKLIDAK